MIEATPIIQIESDGTPVYVQIQRQILSAIGAGTLQPGARMPTVRALAVDLKTSVNTIRQAYDALERDGVLVAQQGRGTFVAEHPPDVVPALLLARIEALAARVVGIARSEGIPPADVGRRIVSISEAEASVEGTDR